MPKKCIGEIVHLSFLWGFFVNNMTKLTHDNNYIFIQTLDENMRTLNALTMFLL